MNLAIFCVFLCLGLTVQGRPQEKPTGQHPLPGGEGSVHKPEILIAKVDESTTVTPGHKDSSEENGSAEEAGRKRRQAEEEHKPSIEGGEGSIHKPEISITKVDESTTAKPVHKDSSEENGSAEEAGRKRRQADGEHKTPLPGGEGRVHKPEISITKVDESTTAAPGHKDSSEENGSAEEAGRKRRQAEEEHKTPLPGGEGSVHKPEVSATKVEESDESPEIEEKETTTKKSRK